MRSVAASIALGVGIFCLACGSSEGSDEPGASSGGSSGSVSSGSGTGGSSGGSTGGGSGGSGAAPPIAVEDLCPIFTSDLCVYLMQCQGARYRDAEHCEQELDCFGMNELLAAAASGAVDYDPSKVGECHARFLESPCTFGFFIFTPDIYEVLSYCPGTVTPKLDVGAACASNGECQEGLYCYKGDDYLCPGECRAFSLEGETCAGSARCADGFECGANETCEPEQVVGSPCDGSCSYSVSCPDDEICATNLWCDRSVGACQSGLLQGETCGAIGGDGVTSTAACAIHLWCDAVGTGTGTCREPSDAGQPCNDEFSACKDGLHCSGYVAFGTGAKLGTCAAPGAVGDECVSNDDCASEVCVLGSCAEPGAASAACDGNADCAPGLLCRDLVCVDAPYPGEACSETGPACAYSRCVAGTCEYHAKVGEACATAADCATGECVGGTCYDGTVCNAPP